MRSPNGWVYELIRAREPYADPIFPEADLLCAIAAKSEGATWEQMQEMFPYGGRFFQAMGQFCRKWMPEWTPSRELGPVLYRAVIRNYCRMNDPAWVAAEWAVE